MNLGMINPVDEGVLALMILLIISGLIGNHLWTSKSPIFEMTYNRIAYVLVCVFFSLFMIDGLFKILKVTDFATFAKDWFWINLLTLVGLISYMLNPHIFLDQEKLIIYLWCCSVSTTTINIIISHIVKT